MLYTEREAAERLAISVKTLRRWRWLRRGPAFVKIGAAVRYPGSDIDAFIAAGRVETDAPQAA
jgi:excisionase family DNA binding protein